MTGDEPAEPGGSSSTPEPPTNLEEQRAEAQMTGTTDMPLLQAASGRNAGLSGGMGGAISMVSPDSPRFGLRKYVGCPQWP